MALITPNFEECSKPTPAGFYLAMITGEELKTTKAGDGQFIRWELELRECDDEKLNGNKIFTNTMTTGKGAFFLRALYKAAVGEDLEAESFDSESLLGKEVRIKLADGIDLDGNPSDFPEVKKFMAI